MNTLKEVRLAQHFTVHSLADRSGVSAATISRLERGKTTPTLRSVRRLSFALGRDPADIVEFCAIVEQIRRKYAHPNDAHANPGAESAPDDPSQYRQPA